MTTSTLAPFMSKESRLYERIPEAPHIVFWIELGGDRQEFDQLSESFEQNKILYEGKYAYPPMAMALPPIPMYFKIIAAVGSLLTIADILYKYLRQKKDNKARSIAFKFNGKELKIEGNYSKEEILLILQNFSKIAAPKEISAISKKRKMQFKSELKELKRNREIFQNLVNVGKSQEKPNKEWISKLKQYQLEKATIESKISFIEELLKE